MVGLIRVMKIDHTVGSKIRVDFDIRTSAGQFDFTVHIDNHGSAGNNEHEAFLELQKILEEALELVRHQLG